jgi:error-prone DNA polymerase
VHLIVGSQVTLGPMGARTREDGYSRATSPRPPSKGEEEQIILLAADRGGYANLCRLLSKGRLRSPKGMSQVSVEEVCEHAEGLIALWGGAHSLLAAEADPTIMAGYLRDAFDDRLYALLARHRESAEPRLERRLRDRAAHYGMPLLAGMETLYHTPARRPLQDVLTCIRHGVTLSGAGRLIHPNAEHALRAPRNFAMLYEDTRDAVARTAEIAERCRFSLNEVRYRYPLERLPDDTTPDQWLRTVTFEGAQERYGRTIPHDVRRQIDKELELIHELEYEGYFLTMWEIVRYCRHHDILCQGRGSAANSVVCFCLGITAIDPVRMGLLFERFISRERAEPPDIDLDIEHDRREEVIQHVYTKYGRTHAAMVANFIRYRAKSAVRDVGKVLGLPETAIERIARVLSHHEFPTPEVISQAGLDPNGRVHTHLVQIMREIEDFPRHLSIHPGGFLLGHEPVHDLVPIENATMPDRTVIQWDKEDVEDLGLFKVDLLGLGALNVVHRAFDLIEKHNDTKLTLATVPPEDEATYEMTRQGDTVGVFQIESRAQMSMLPRLKPRNYYDLVIQISIVRPGPITGGMVHPYLRRRNGEEVVEYPHPCLEPILKKTFGVPLFQEQVMQLAMVAADYTPGEADQLRRDMAAWRRSGRIEQHRERLITRMARKGIQREFAERVFDQIRGFGEYGFPESHAASFALIAYATAWLKRHHPGVFLCALLNAQPMGFYSPATLVEDAKRHGVTVLPVDVQDSDWDCSLKAGGRGDTSGDGAPRAGLEACTQGGVSYCGAGVPPAHLDLEQKQQQEGEGESEYENEYEYEYENENENDTGNWSSSMKGGRPAAPKRTREGGGDVPPVVRMGLRYVKGLHEADGQHIVAARGDRPFRSLDDFAARTRLSARVMARLAEAGALECFHEQRRTALWDALGVDAHHDDSLRLESAEPSQGFDPLNSMETIQWDYAFTSHSPRGHPMAPLREALSKQKLPDAATVRTLPNGRRVKYAGLVICRQRPGTANGVVFMTLEDETGFVNLVVWEKVFDRQTILAKTAHFLGVTGKLQNQNGVTHLVAEHLWIPEVDVDPAETKPRNFR